MKSAPLILTLTLMLGLGASAFAQTSVNPSSSPRPTVSPLPFGTEAPRASLTPAPIPMTPLPLVQTATPAAQRVEPKTPAPQVRTMTPVSQAQPVAAASGKVGFVDMEVVLDSSRAIRTIIGELDQALAVEARVIEEKKTELERTARELERQGSVLSDSERRRRQDRAGELRREIDDLQYRFTQRLREEQRATVDPMLEEVLRIVGDVGKQENYDLIVRGEVVLYGRSVVDVTPAVIVEMDKQIDRLRQVARRPINAAASPTPSVPRELQPLIPRAQ